MKRHLNTLFVTTDGAWLFKDGQAVAVRVEKETRLRVPLHNLDGIVCLGYEIGVNPPLMAACSEAGVTISFLSPHGKFLAAVTGFPSGNVLLRREQYRQADCPLQSLAIARRMVAVKIANCRTLLQRGLRDHPERPGAPEVETAVQRLARGIEAAQAASSLESLRGVEGEHASHYFGAMAHLITVPDPALAFTGRNRRPPLDPVNALLSFLYSLLAHDARSALEAAGLDAAVGFLHRDRPGRPSLALDLSEEFRAFLADRLCLTLLNRQQLRASDFITRETGAVEMTEPARKSVLVAYQERKQQEIQHPFLGEKTSVGLLVHLQARLLARYLRGDLDAYPPFLWK